MDERKGNEYKEGAKHMANPGDMNDYVNGENNLRVCSRRPHHRVNTDKISIADVERGWKEERDQEYPREEQNRSLREVYDSVSGEKQRLNLLKTKTPDKQNKLRSLEGQTMKGEGKNIKVEQNGMWFTRRICKVKTICVYSEKARMGSY